MRRQYLRIRLLILFVLLGVAGARAEDGYEVWLRYHRIADESLRAHYWTILADVVVEGNSPTMAAAREELRLGLHGLLGTEPPGAPMPSHEGVLVVGTPASSPVIASLDLGTALGEGGDEGYIIRTMPVDGKHATVIAGVSNIGTDRNWTGSHFDQVNWYAFGRLAWNPSLSSEEIAAHWIRMTFTNDPSFVEPVQEMMLGSWQAAVNYMTPLGLYHLMGRGHHYGPGPWVSGGPRADWTSVYYHRADSAGIGFDRTATGSDADTCFASS